jgi:hypothetical protein
MRLVLTGLTALTLAACGGGGGGGDPDAGPDGGGLECGPAELRVVGALDGAPVDLRYPLAGQAVDNTPADVPCRANIYLAPPGGRLKLEWPLPLAEGGASEARGELNLEARDGPAVGNCALDGFPSRLTRFSATGVEFELEALKRLPACGGLAVAGELRGCARFP